MFFMVLLSATLDAGVAIALVVVYFMYVLFSVFLSYLSEPFQHTISSKRSGEMGFLSHVLRTRTDGGL